MPFPTEEELQEQKATFEREYLVLDATVVDGRKVVAKLFEVRGLGAISAGSTAELPREVQDTLASIIDYARDCMDVADDASQTEMLGYGDQLDAMIGELYVSGYCLCAARRRTNVTNKSWSDPTPLALDITYLVAAPSDKAPSKLAVSRKFRRP